MSFDLSRVRVSGPLSGLAARFTDHMVQRGYRPISARKHIWLFNHLSNWLVSEGLGIEIRREGSRTVSAQPLCSRAHVSSVNRSNGTNSWLFA